VVTVAPLESEVAAFVRLEPAALAGRWRIYARLRAEAPAFEYGNSVLITRYEDVVALLTDRDRVHNGGPSHGVPREVLERLTPAEHGMLAEIIDWEERWLTSANGQRHVELRDLGRRIFSPRAIADMHARTVELTEALLDQISGRDTVELVSDLAYKLPLAIISEILDIPVDLREGFHATAAGMRVARTGLAWRTQLPRNLEAAHHHFMEMRRRIVEVMDLRRGSATTPMMQNMLEAAADSRASLDDVIVMMQLLVTAGHHTTTDLLGNGMHALMTHREQWERLCASPELNAPTAVEEVLRYRSPAQDVERFAAADFELHGVEIARGRHLTIVVGSANFDDDVFADPERFDISRSGEAAHMAFGRGTHFCLGNALARMEGQIGLAAIARRFPDAELVEPEPEWAPNTHLLGLSRLPLRLGRDHG
jgi:cytochrome P450